MTSLGEKIMFDAGRRPMRRLFCFAVTLAEAAGLAALINLVLAGGVMRAAAAPQSGPPTTTVSDTVYRADGTRAQGALIISWPAFITSGGSSIAAGTTNVTLGTNGALSVALVPNTGANPAGVYYTVVYQLDDGTSKVEYWLVPTNSPVDLAEVRTTPGSGIAAQPVSMQYVNTALATKANDNAVVHLSGAETVTGLKSFATPPNVPTPVNTGDVANKAYVDTAVGNVGAGNFLPIVGGTLTGALTLSANPVAPLQATPKQYVDAAFASKADLIGGLVPPAELGSGTANSGTCLLGNGTWGTCGTGGTGNVSTAPAASQNITQPIGTQFGVNNVNGVRYVTLSPSTYNWSQAISGTLTGGTQSTVTLSQCPAGIFGTDTTSFVSINNGVEYAQLQGGGTCVPGQSLKTIKFTTVGTYTNPTLSSASSGIQEALTDAQTGGTGTVKNNFKVVFQPTNPANTAYYTINAAVTVPGGIADIDGSGTSIDCEASDKCFYFAAGELVLHGFRVATRTTMPGATITQTACAANVATITTTLNPPVGSYVDIQWTDSPHYWGIYQVATSSSSNFTFTDNNCTHRATPGTGSLPTATTPGGVAPEHAFLEDAGNGLTVRDIYFDPPGWATGNLNSWFVVDGDEAFGAENVYVSGNANGGLACSANYCGQAFYAPGGSAGEAIGNIRHSSLSLGCQGNGVKWLAGNGFKITDFSVVQGFQQFGVMGGTLRGGFGGVSEDTTYMEVGGCSNPLMTAAGFTGQAAFNMAGTVAMGNNVFLSGVAPGASGSTVGQEPVFASGSNSSYEYWLVICDGANCSLPLRFGQSWPTNSNSYTIGWARYASQTASTVTYWVLRGPGPGSVPFTAPYGTGNWSLTSSAIPQCSGLICTMTDSTSTTLRSYTVATNPTLIPNLWNWPGGVVLGGGATLYTNDTPTTNVSAIVATKQDEPTVFAERLGNATPGVYISAVGGNSLVNSNPAVGGAILQNGTVTNGQPAGLKGRLNFSAGANGSVNSGHIITLNDSNPAKTVADANHRPINDANDVYIGLDQGVAGLSLAQLSFGAPAAISNYIGNVGDNTSWGERLTAGLKEFKVAAKFDSTVTFSGITGSGWQCLHVSATGALSGTGNDCGTGSGGLTNPMTSANDMIIGGAGGAPTRLPSVSNSFMATNASGVPAWSPLPVTGASQYQLAMYSASGATVSGDSALTDNGTTLNYSGSGGISAATGNFNGNLTVNGQLLVAGPWMVASPIPGTPMAASGAGTSALGISNDGNFYISANAGTPQKVATTATSSYFTNLFQEDANDVGEYNGTNPQNLHVYSSYTNSTTWTRTSLGYDSTDSYAVVRSESAPSGSAPGLGFWINSGLKWVFDATGNLRPWTDQSYNIGSFNSSGSGSGLRPGTVFVAGNSTSGSGLELGKFASLSYELCNDGTTGTVVNGLAVLTSGGCAAKPASALTSGAIGIAIANAGTSGVVTLARTGSAYCSFDATATVVGDYVVPSSGTSAYLCHDSGATRPTGVQILGRVLQASSGSATVQIFLDMPGSSMSGGAGSCTNQMVTAVNAGAPTCTTVTSAYVDSSIAPTASPAFTGTATAPTPATSDSSTKIATTAWVNAQGYGTGSGNVSGPASSTTGNIATFNGTNGKTIQDSGTAVTSLAPLASPTFTGAPLAPTASTGDNSTKIATTAYVKNEAQFAWTCPVAGSTAVSQNCNWTLPAALTITGFDLAANTAPVGCATYATLQVWDGTAAAEVGSYSIVLSSGTNFYTQVTGSANVAAGHLLRVKVTTAASGCSTNAAGLVATVSYQMQN